MTPPTKPVLVVKRGSLSSQAIHDLRTAGYVVVQEKESGDVRHFYPVETYSIVQAKAKAFDSALIDGRLLSSDKDCLRQHFVKWCNEIPALKDAMQPPREAMTAERKNAPLPELMVWEMPSGTVHICTRKSPHCIIATLPRKGSAAVVSADLEDVAFGDGIVEAVNQHAALSAEVERLRDALEWIATAPWSMPETAVKRAQQALAGGEATP